MAAGRLKPTGKNQRRAIQHEQLQSNQQRSDHADAQRTCRLQDRRKRVGRVARGGERQRRREQEQPEQSAQNGDRREDFAQQQFPARERVSFQHIGIRQQRCSVSRRDEGVGSADLISAQSIIHSPHRQCGHNVDIQISRA